MGDYIYLVYQRQPPDDFNLRASGYIYITYETAFHSHLTSAFNFSLLYSLVKSKIALSNYDEMKVATVNFPAEGSSHTSSESLIHAVRTRNARGIYSSVNADATPLSSASIRETICRSVRLVVGRFPIPGKTLCCDLKVMMTVMM